MGHKVHKGNSLKEHKAMCSKGNTSVAQEQHLDPCDNFAMGVTYRPLCPNVHRCVTLLSHSLDSVIGYTIQQHVVLSIT
jgi:hypothetical protein